MLSLLETRWVKRQSVVVPSSRFAGHDYLGPGPEGAAHQGARRDPTESHLPARLRQCHLPGEGTGSAVGRRSYGGLSGAGSRLQVATEVRGRQPRCICPLSVQVGDSGGAQKNERARKEKRQPVS